MVRKQAMAQAQQLKAPSTMHSLNVVRGLMKVSIYHVAYLRGMFDEENFVDNDSHNLGNIVLKHIQPVNDETKKLVEWVTGVDEAIALKYLKSLVFGLSTDAENKCIIEEYIYAFSYDHDGEVSMECNGQKVSAVKGKKKAKTLDMDTIRFQVMRLLRMLVQICQTLDSVPQERYLFMHLMYHSNTPQDYQPPGFTSADDDIAGHFTSKPFSMKVGEVNINDCTVALKVKSALDPCGSGMDDANMDGTSMHGSAWAGETSISGSDNGDKMQIDEEHASQKHADAAIAAPQSLEDDPKKRLKADMAELFSEPQEAAGTSIRLGMGTADAQLAVAAAAAHLDAIKAFCLKRTSVEFTDLLASFISIPSDVVGRCITQLVQEGLLRPTGLGSEQYMVCKVVGGAAGPQNAAQLVADRLTSLTVAPADEGSGAKAMSDDAMGNDAEGHSVRGKLHSVPGSEGTISGRRPLPKTLDAGVVNGVVHGSQQPEEVFYESQQSIGLACNKAKMVRKASKVLQPIHQVQKPRTKAKAQRKSSRLSNME